MKYCTYCKKVLGEEISSCKCQTEYSFYSRGEIKLLPIEANCEKCGSDEELEYREPWTSGSYTFGNYCTCHVCIEKAENERSRQEAMKYLLVDNYSGERHFFDTKEDVEEFLEEFIKDEPWDMVSIVNEDVLILKLEEMENLKKSDFDYPKNTNIVVYDGEMYRIEEVINPSMEAEGEYTISW